MTSLRPNRDTRYLIMIPSDRNAHAQAAKTIRRYASPSDVSDMRKTTNLKGNWRVPLIRPSKRLIRATSPTETVPGSSSFSDLRIAAPNLCGFVKIK